MLFPCKSCQIKKKITLLDENRSTARLRKHVANISPQPDAAFFASAKLLLSRYRSNVTMATRFSCPNTDPTTSDGGFRVHIYVCAIPWPRCYTSYPVCLVFFVIRQSKVVSIGWSNGGWRHARPWMWTAICNESWKVDRLSIVLRLSQHPGLLNNLEEHYQNDAKTKQAFILIKMQSPFQCNWTGFLGAGFMGVLWTVSGGQLAVSHRQQAQRNAQWFATAATAFEVNSSFDLWKLDEVFVSKHLCDWSHWT